MSWALLSGILSLLGSLLLGYPAARSARALKNNRLAEKTNSSDRFEKARKEMEKLSQDWLVKYYWMMNAGFASLFFAGVATILEVKNINTPW